MISNLILIPFDLIKDMKKVHIKYSVTELCEVFNVSMSSYH
jgi:hypothetical protein